MRRGRGAGRRIRACSRNRREPGCCRRRSGWRIRSSCSYTTVRLTPHSRLRPSLTHGALRLTGKRRACAGEFLVELEFCLLLVGELAGALDVLEALVDIYIAGCLVQQGAASVKASLDVGNHLVDGGEGLRCTASSLTIALIT